MNARRLFSSALPPRPYYARPAPGSHTPLPLIKKRWPLLLGAVALGASGWAAFLTAATNHEKHASSVVAQILRTARASPALGGGVRAEGAWLLNGAPWIHGRINTLAGHVDLSFRVRGRTGRGTLYFTSVRREKGGPFTILRFKVIGEDGTVVHLPTTAP